MHIAHVKRVVNVPGSAIHDSMRIGLIRVVKLNHLRDEVGYVVVEGIDSRDVTTLADDEL